MLSRNKQPILGFLDSRSLVLRIAQSVHKTFDFGDQVLLVDGLHFSDSISMAQLSCWTDSADAYRGSIGRFEKDQ